MKPYIPFLFLLAACAPTSPNPSTDFLNSNAEWSGNVSALYALTSVGSGTGIEIKWRDSTSQVHKLSDYQGKPVILAFGLTTDALSDQQFAALDSVRAEMGDSVRTIAIAHDPSGFRTVSLYASSQHRMSQFISDSARRVQIQFSQRSDGHTYTPESFVLGLDGKIVDGGVTAGLEDKASLEALVRKAYHP